MSATTNARPVQLKLGLRQRQTLRGGQRRRVELSQVRQGGGVATPDEALELPALVPKMLKSRETRKTADSPQEYSSRLRLCPHDRPKRR